jgi:hypothetical protein
MTRRNKKLLLLERNEFILTSLFAQRRESQHSFIHCHEKNGVSPLEEETQQTARNKQQPTCDSPVAVSFFLLCAANDRDKTIRQQ